MGNHWMAFSQAGPGGSLEVKLTIVRGYEVASGALGFERKTIQSPFDLVLNDSRV